jgi:ribokinase
LVSDAGENMIVSVPGANAAADPGIVPDSLLSRAPTVALQHELADAANDALMERARRNGSPIVLNVSPWRTLSRDTLCTVGYLVLNEHEAEALAIDFDWPRSPHDLALAASNAMRDLAVIVTLGPRGAIAARGSELLRADAPIVEAIDTTGAGDAFIGTLIATLDAQVALDGALRCAVIAGSLACTAAGAQPSFPERSAVDAVLRRTGEPIRCP